MTNGVKRAIKPRPLAVPKTKDPINFGLIIKMDMLASPDCGCRQLFIDCWLECNPIFFQQIKIAI